MRIRKRHLYSHLILGPGLVSAQSEKPSVVLILIDDMGWNEMGFAGNAFIETPRTDALVCRGVHFGA